MDAARARQEIQIQNLEKRQDKQEEFCRDCQKELLGEIASIKTELAINKLKLSGWHIIVALITGIAAGFIGAFLWNAANGG